MLGILTRPRASMEKFEPSNITFGLLPPPRERIRKKRDRRAAVCQHALEELERWVQEVKTLLKPSAGPTASVNGSD